MRASQAKPDWSKIRYKKLIFNNFGPFKGKHEINFKLKPEIVGIFHIEGENGTGKSTIVRAFKFLFQGDKAELNLDLRKLVNYHQQKDFDDDTLVDTYVSLTLEVQPEVDLDNDRSSKEPLEVTMTRKISGSLKNLKTDDPKIRIEQDDKDEEYTSEIMETYFTDGIVRFLFYDGEISEDFETLLRSDSPQSVGKKIKEEIVGILGIDNLKTLKEDLVYVHRKIDAEIDLEATKVSSNKYHQEQINNLEEKINYLKKEETKATVELGELKKKKADFETYFKNHKGSQEITVEIGGCQSVIAKYKRDEEESLKDIRTVFDEKASKMLIAPWIRLESKKVKIEEVEKGKELEKIQIWNHKLDNLEKMINSGICETCQSQLSLDKISNFKTMIVEMRSHTQSQKEISNKFNKLTQKREALEKIIINEDLEFFKKSMDKHESVRMKIDEQERKIKDLNDQMRGINIEEVRLKKKDSDINEQHIGIKEKVLATARQERETAELEIDKIRDKLVNISETTKEKKKLATFLSSTIEKAIGLFASEVKNSVEKDANEIFLHLTTSNEFKELKLSSNFALSIKLEHGTEVPLPSMAQNRTLILSLIAALHKNSDLRAPLVMDSAFTGFDEGHKKNILKALHKISTQVILLTFKDELPLSESKNTLGVAIQGQARLKRNEWGNSEIEEV